MITVISLLGLIAFVFGMSVVIDGYFEFFGDENRKERFYNYRRPKTTPGFFACEPFIDRPLWQKFILKPTIYCNVCMSSFWGTVYYWVLLQGDSWRHWIVFCVVCAGSIWFINHVVKAIDRNA